MAARRRGSRAGTFLALCGIFGVLTATFLGGVWTGLNWPLIVATVKGGPLKAERSAEAGGKRVSLAERPKPADTLPMLTFYDELKAPLTAPPPPPRPAKPKKPAEPVRKEEMVDGPPLALPPPLPEPGVPPPLTTVAGDAASRFTVQVAAYHVRTPAETLRATLAAAGHDARVVEVATPGGVRYRVQVGTFVTRQAAQDAAARLRAERALSTFVTTR